MVHFIMNKFWKQQSWEKNMKIEHKQDKNKDW